MSKKNVISKSEMVALHNAVTGEMETAKVTVMVQRDKPKYRGEPFTMLFQAVNKAVARDMKPVTAKMLLFLCSVAEYGNTIDLEIHEISNELNYKKRHVLTALKELEELRVIIRHKNPADKRKTLITINPLHSWKGSVGDRKKAISVLDKNQLKLGLFEQKELAENTNFLQQSNEHSLLQ